MVGKENFHSASSVSQYGVLFLDGKFCEEAGDTVAVDLPFSM